MTDKIEGLRESLSSMKNAKDSRQSELVEEYEQVKEFAKSL